MLLQLRHVEDIVDLLEPALDVKFVGCLSYALQHPEWSHEPSFELPSTCKVKGLQRIVALLLLPDAPTACDIYQSSASNSLVLFSGDSWRPGLAAGRGERS